MNSLWACLPLASLVMQRSLSEISDERIDFESMIINTLLVKSFGQT